MYLVSFLSNRYQNLLDNLTNIHRGEKRKKEANAVKGKLKESTIISLNEDKRLSNYSISSDTC